MKLNIHGAKMMNSPDTQRRQCFHPLSDLCHHHLLNRFIQTFLETFMVPNGCILMSLVIV